MGGHHSNHPLKETQVKIHKLPPVAILRELFIADPEAGTLTLKSTGYVYAPRSSTTINGLRYRVHRILYTMYTGRDPGSQYIDHINRDPSDNRRCNLRTLSAAENTQNKRAYSNTGYRGVYLRPCKDGTPRYMVHIHRKVQQADGTLKPTTYHFGVFYDLQEAVCKAEEMFIKHGTDLFVPVSEFHAHEVTPVLPREAC